MYVKITEQAWNSIPKHCETCEENYLCEMEGTLQNEACSSWKPQLRLFDEKFEEITKNTPINYIDKALLESLKKK